MFMGPMILSPGLRRILWRISKIPLVGRFVASVRFVLR